MLLSLNQYIQNQWILSGGHYYIVEAINAKKKVKKNQMYKITYTTRRAYFRNAGHASGIDKKGTF